MLAPSRLLWPLLLALIVALSPACDPKGSLAPRTQTFAELRGVRGVVEVTPPEERERSLLPQERLADGAAINVPADGLAWLRRDGGSTWLVRGPAELIFHAENIEVLHGRLFVDAPGSSATPIDTPQGTVHLAGARASLDVTEGGGTELYVLAGEVRAPDGNVTRAGERLVMTGTAAQLQTKREPAVVWQDWTGGLATTDRTPSPPPLGVGTVLARKPGQPGGPRAPLAIQRMEVRVEVDGDLAITEVDQRFFNASSERVEGVYTFRTPLQASISRFGIDRDGLLVWGRVKERGAAAAQYAANVFEGSQENPALLEWDAPGTYRAKLYPIEPGQTRRVVIRYSEWLPRSGHLGERRLYVFPMAAEGSDDSLPHIEHFVASLDLSQAGAREVRVGMNGTVKGKRVLVRAHDLVPRADLSVELFDEGMTQQPAYKAQHGVDAELFKPSERAAAMARSRDEMPYVFLPIRAADVPRAPGGLDLVLVVDTSAATDSASVSLASSCVTALLTHLGADDRAVVFASDTGLRPIIGDWHELQKVDDTRRRQAAIALATAQRGGATDLGSVLTAAAGLLDPARRGAVVYLGDGRSTVGEMAVADLREKLAKLPRPPRIFALGVGQDADLGVLSGVAQAGFAERIGDAASAARTALRLLEMAERPALLGVSVDLGPAVERVYPRDLNTLVAGETVLLVGRISDREPTEVTITTPLGSTKHPIKLVNKVDRGDVATRWATGRLDQMLTDASGRAALVDLGMRFGLITPFTSLYVPTSREMSPEEREELRQKSRQLQGAMFPTNSNPRHRAGLQLGIAGCSRSAPTGMDEQPVSKPFEESSMGSPTSSDTDKRYGVAGPAEPSPAPPRAAALREAAEFGMIGLSAGSGEEAPAQEGLALSGIGEGGGGKGDGIGLGSIGTIGHGSGTGKGTGQAFGSGLGRLGGSHRSSSASVGLGELTVTGALPREVIQRLLRQQTGRLRLCYEAGLRNNPNLQGRVAVRFVVSREGTTTVSNAGSDLPDSSVVACVMSAYRAMTFPAPAQGIVTIVAPVRFSPAGGTPRMAPTPRTFRPIKITLLVEELPHQPPACSGGASAPLSERIALWKERLTPLASAPFMMPEEYARAISTCEAPTWFDRARLLSLMLDILPTVSARVILWESMQAYPLAADTLYRGLLARVRTTEETRELHAALGLKIMDPGALERAWRNATTAERRVAVLRDLARQWPNDFALALRLLDALEDRGDDAGGRAFARTLRERADADAHVRTQVGEFYLRQAKKAQGDAARDYEAEAQRTFGEIVEFAPDEPIARRRLGDLLRAHGWHNEAARQYETLAKLVPDDTSVQLLIAAAVQGQGKIDEAVRRAEKITGDGAPDEARGLGRTARVLAATYLAWARTDPKINGQRAALRNRGLRLLSQADRASGHARAVLTWSHPELHPSLWHNSYASMMPASDGDASLGVIQAVVPVRNDSALEVRLEPRDLEHAARLGATATLTVVFDEGQDNERIVVKHVTFAQPTATLRYALAEGEVQP